MRRAEEAEVEWEGERVRRGGRGRRNRKEEEKVISMRMRRKEEEEEGRRGEEREEGGRRRRKKKEEGERKGEGGRRREEERNRERREEGERRKKKGGRGEEREEGEMRKRGKPEPIFRDKYLETKDGAVVGIKKELGEGSELGGAVPSVRAVNEDGSAVILITQHFSNPASTSKDFTQNIEPKARFQQVIPVRQCFSIPTRCHYT